VDSVEKPLFYHVIIWTDLAATVKMGAEDESAEIRYAGVTV